MDSYDIGLGNNDSTIRALANQDNVKFWESQAENLFWSERWHRALEWNPPFARWFVGGKTNASYNALDVAVKKNPHKKAILWEGEDGSNRTLTYQDLLFKVAKLANALKKLGVKKGDRVTIYLPMVPELIISLLACARIGAIHTVIFSGFSAQSIRDRVIDSKSSVIITADGGRRRGTIIQLKNVVDDAIEGLDFIQSVIVLEHTGNQITYNAKDKKWNEFVDSMEPLCNAEMLDSSHPLYILYTSGTTGKPKGVLHGTGGYLTHVFATFKWIFDIRDSDVYFCTADIGWVTGHSYVVYGPLMHGATQVMYEGALDYDTPARIWEIISRYRVTILYTTPTALRMFMKSGDKFPNSNNLTSLRLLGTVGEPINPQVWKWYFKTIGKEKCPIVDTWWQTETGAAMISPLPGIETIRLKPGSAARPVPGICISVVDDDGKQVPKDSKGYLVVENPWPGMLLTLWGNDEKYKTVYWSKYKHMYYAGDYAMQDKDGYVWMLGRADDVLKVAGHRLGTAEIESGFVSHKTVAEAAVCGVPHEVKGESIIAFVVLKDGITPTQQLKKDLVTHIRKTIGPIASPDQLFFVKKLPKTRSGKIMRRLLKAITQDEKINDVSTLEDEASVDEIKSALADLQHTLGRS
ncbi:acetate--CoA ligase [Candidatus Nitrosotalea okcheonensis]|uniref:Acetate--CoA ligase n=1 Tax=Candidatus Nitrosotalea okcheonensis TaxID=1903276 RepID=A0A2H1FEB3_9ARCH|nr:acetate--CoA ligase [Candidatus Nitrosotalea okcheonensis]SMH71097.1 Acetyl-coenzyme A synthetase [Candidatus Nitrosotalea okcheonensis]